MQKCILKTLAYADLFNYPLNSEELYRFFISDHALSPSVFNNALSRIYTNDKRIDTNGKYFFLKGRREVVDIRKERERWSKEKIRIVHETAEKLKTIPTIKLIGVTGALAMENCDEDDDIDLLIVTARNSLWLTRFLIIALCPILGIKRRKPNDKNVKDKICFNLFLDEDNLKIEPESLFLAHEICQVRLLFNKDNIHERFLWENRWVRKFLPNVIGSSNLKSQITLRFAAKPQLKTKNFFLTILNLIAFHLQHLYMRPKMTVEKVTLHQAFFHPSDISKKVQREYKTRLRLLGLDKERG